MRAILRRVLVIGAAASGMSTVTIPANAQYQRQPIVLVHGFFASGDDWGGTQEWFHDHLYVTAYSWTTGWSQRFLDQSSALRYDMLDIGLPDTTILVAHSFGGLVSRLTAENLAIKGLLTIGTPHRGAPIAASIRNGELDEYAYIMIRDPQTALDDYNFVDAYNSPFCFTQDNPDGFCDDELWFARAAAYTAQGIGAAVGAIPAIFYGDALTQDGGSLRDAVPSSGFIAQLNSADNLNHEAATISKRVALGSRYTGWASPIWAVPSESGGPYMTSLTDGMISELLFAADYYRNYSHYEDPDYWAKIYFWEDWLQAAGPLINLDNAWCTWTGAIDQNGNCVASDGLFSLNDQQWTAPGTTNDFITGPVHTSEKGAGAFQSKAFDYLLNTFGVKQFAPPSNNPTVYIQGPYPTMPGNYTYTAYASGGIGSYTYSWQMSVDGSYFWDTAVTDPQITVYLDYGNPLWLRVTVSTGTGSGSYTQYIPGICATGGVLVC